MKAALLTRVRKDHVLSNDERFQSVMERFNASAISPEAQSGSSSDHALEKVEARIRSSKHVAEVMKECVESLRCLVLGKEKEKGSRKDNDAGEREPTVESEADPEIEPEAARFSDEDHENDTEVIQTATADDEREEDAFDDAGWESGSVVSLSQSGEPDVVSDEEGGWESGSVDSDAPPNKKAKAKSKGTKSSSDLPKKPPVQAASGAMSTFLPALSVGYLPGGSSASDEDEWSDGGGAAARKNRRGQRARRA